VVDGDFFPQKNNRLLQSGVLLLQVLVLALQTTIVVAIFLLPYLVTSTLLVLLARIIQSSYVPTRQPLVVTLLVY
jgi:hypothetical protein